MVNKGVGIDIDNYLTTLMMKKGLSRYSLTHLLTHSPNHLLTHSLSSAAICVTVVRCFNLVYDLELSINEIIDYAFNGERLTHSLCGKMDFVVGITH
jgi:galactokinase